MSYNLSGCLVVWFTDCLVDCPVVCLSYNLAGCLVVWFDGCLVDCPVVCLSYNLAGCLVVCFTGCLVDCPVVCLSYNLAGCLVVWFTRFLVDCLVVVCLCVVCSDCLMICPPDWLVVSPSLMSRSFSSLFSSTLSQESPHFRPCSSGWVTHLSPPYQDVY